MRKNKRSKKEDDKIKSEEEVIKNSFKDSEKNKSKDSEFADEILSERHYNIDFLEKHGKKVS